MAYMPIAPRFRNTSMHMEKIYLSFFCFFASEKHLHAHGENLIRRKQVATATETPPCTWRKFFLTPISYPCIGNTSMHMEKIRKLSTFETHQQKHLHAHGENPVIGALAFAKEETPPCTWRKSRFL